MKLASLFHRASLTVAAERSEEQGMGRLYTVFALLAGGMLMYSQTQAFHWDEGFHILTADLIAAGKRPYLDFFFPQTPLNAYWNAAWMRILGVNWRVVHAVAALITLGSVLLIAQYLFALFPDRRWKSAAAFAALALFGLHSLVWEFGTTSQAYPLCLLLLVAAFRTAIVAVARPQFRMSALAGLLAGAGAASSLLTAPASAVLLFWMWLYNRAGNRWFKAVAFVSGAVIPCAPMLFLFAGGPHQVIFDILKYHSIYRRVDWEGATSHDVGIVTDWVNSSPSLLLVLLAVAGLFFIKKSSFNHERRSEFRLCLWLALAIGAQNLVAHPTFPQYFVFLIPFLTVLGVVGFSSVVARLEEPNYPGRPVLVLLCITTLCLGNSLYNDRDSYTWHQFEKVAKKVKEVTPKDAPLLAPEQIYFLARWPVPSGMEHSDANKLQLPETENATLHILPKAEVDRRLKSGAFPTTVVCDDDARVSELEEWKIYSKKADIDECTVFWQLDKNTPRPHPQR
jgi:hypothetical protein